LAITEFEEKYTEATVDKILEEIWMSPVDKELYKNLILNTDSDISNRAKLSSFADLSSSCAIFLRSCANLFFSSLKPFNSNFRSCDNIAFVW
jgi:hypothetical protein